MGAHLPFGGSLFHFVCIFPCIDIAHVHILKTIQYSLGDWTTVCLYVCLHFGQLIRISFKDITGDARG